MLGVLEWGEHWCGQIFDMRHYMIIVHFFFFVRGCGRCCSYYFMLKQLIVRSLFLVILKLLNILKFYILYLFLFYLF
jgi:hypothetical protein